MSDAMTPYIELAVSGDAAGKNVGRLPRSIALQDLRDLGHPESPIKAIRAKCIECSGARPACAISRIARFGRSGWVTARFTARQRATND